MIERLSRINHRRFIRHALFWAVWVFGFTFVKSFGAPADIYFGWFVYYIITLPLFVIHTCLIVYWLIPFYFKNRRYPVFAFLFLVLFSTGSVLDLVVSHEFVYRYYSIGPFGNEQYLTAGNIVINGLGNLYIIVVFLAARSIRIWYLNQESEKKKFRCLLALEVNRTIAMVHPELLIYSVNNIEKLAGKSPEHATRAIALTSEILSEILFYGNERQQSIEREFSIIQKFINLLIIFRNTKPEVEFFISGDPVGIKFPPLILFSLVEMIFLQFNKSETPEIVIEISGFSNMATIQVLHERTLETENQFNECAELLKHIGQFYPDQITVAFEHTLYGCAVVIKAAEQPMFNHYNPVREIV
ncbi:MAG: hypothetical protein JXR52_05920 [Bacteroidales bacterium]|nr:hypothetical protein [Bacteroidales bacterium]MBN2698345.1 hypothetical protein [Bacteroidales bacterium]